MSLVNLLVQFSSSKTVWPFFNTYYHQQLQFGHDLWPFTYLTLRSDAPRESSGFYVLHPEPFDISLDLMSLVNLLVQFASSKTLWQFFNTYYHQQLQIGHDLWPFTYLILRYDAQQLCCLLPVNPVGSMCFTQNLLTLDPCYVHPALKKTTFSLFWAD
jgi:hypothetical protein